MHWIHPWYKKGAASKPGNYRGVHITSVLSKVAERSIGHVFLIFLDQTNAYCENQWAFRKRHSCRDLITVKLLQCILTAHQGKRTGLFLSDISGALDSLLRKFQRAGLGDQLCSFLNKSALPAMQSSSLHRVRTTVVECICCRCGGSSG